MRLAGSFAVSCVLLPIVLDLFVEEKPLFFDHNAEGGLASCFFDYAFNTTTITWLAILVPFLWLAHRPGTIELTTYEREAAGWFLVNAFFFNGMMDVFAGQLQLWPGMTARYNSLEPRYQRCVGFLNGCEDAEGLAPYLTSLQEIGIQVPLGFAVYYGYVRGLPERRALELVHVSWQVAGVWYFYVAEAVSGLKMFQEYETWTPVNKALNFWLGFVFFPLVWVVIPVMLGAKALSELSMNTEIADAIVEVVEFEREDIQNGEDTEDSFDDDDEETEDEKHDEDDEASDDGAEGGKFDEEEEVGEEEMITVRLGLAELQQLKVVELKELLKARSLPLYGAKRDLIMRILEFDDARAVAAQQ